MVEQKIPSKLIMWFHLKQLCTNIRPTRYVVPVHGLSDGGLHTVTTVRPITWVCVLHVWEIASVLSKMTTSVSARISVIDFICPYCSKEEVDSSYTHMWVKLMLCYDRYKEWIQLICFVAKLDKFNRYILVCFLVYENHSVIYFSPVPRLHFLSKCLE